MIRLLLLACLVIQAQTPNDTLIRITVKLVQVDAVVVDSKGRHITDLQPADFEIYEDGKLQKITTFSNIQVTPEPVPSAVQPLKRPKHLKVAAPLPPATVKREDVRRTIVLVVDDLNLSFENAVFVRRALKKFISEQVQPGDLVSIMKTSVGVPQQFTADKEQLLAIAERVRWYPGTRGEEGPLAPLGSDPIARAFDQGPPGYGNATSSFEITYAAIKKEVESTREEIFTVGTLGSIRQILDGLRFMPGRKCLILLSDSLPIFVREGEPSIQIVASLRRLTDLANRASVVLYTVDTRGLQTLAPGAADNPVKPEEVTGAVGSRLQELFDSDEGLSFLAKETGGLFLHDSNDIAYDLRRVLEDTNSYYLIGYSPHEDTFKDEGPRAEYHKIVVKVKRKGLTVRSRRGFYGTPDSDQPPVPKTRREQLLAAMTSPFIGADVRMRMTPLFSETDAGGYVLRPMLYINAHDLTFSDEPDSVHKAVIDVLATTYGDHGNVVDTLDKTYAIRLKDAEYKQVIEKGFLYAMDVPLKKPGAYQFRTAVRDSESGKVGSASQFLQIPDVAKGRLAMSSIVLQAEEADAEGYGSAAVRKFQSGQAVLYGLQIFNARLDPSTKLPKILTQLRLYRDGVLMHAGPVTKFKAEGSPDLKRISAAFQTRIPPNLNAGSYVLQLVLTDELAKEKVSTAAQWIDFEIVKR